MTGERGLEEPEAGEAPELDAALPSEDLDDDGEAVVDVDELDEDEELVVDLPDDVFALEDDDAEDADAEESDAEESDGEESDGEESDDDAADPVVVDPWEPPAHRFKWARRLLGLVVVGAPAAAIAVVIGQAAGLGGGDDADVDPAFANALRYDAKGNLVVLKPAVSDIGTVKRLSWQVCGADCDAVSGHGPSFRPGEVLAGSRVQVRVAGTTGNRTLTTPGWDGQLKVLRRPALVGQPTVGTIATATAGKWTGGWLGGTTNLGLRACPTRLGGGKCVAFTASILQSDGHEPKRTIPASFKGWYIGAIEWQIAPGRTAPAKPLTDPATPKDAQQAPQRGATVALGPLNGPIR